MILQAASSSRLVTPGGQIVRLETGSCELLLKMFVPRSGRVAIETENGVRTLSVTRAALVWCMAAHIRGVRRLALFPTLTSRLCRWGCLDLDAHGDAAPDRHADAAATLDVLDREGIHAYMNASRGGRGAHVWLLFDPPGVPAGDLFAYLSACAEGLRVTGPVDTFPSSPTGAGRAIFLPGFGGVVDLLDADLKRVPLDKLSSNPVQVIPHVPAWPPSYWKRGISSGKAKEFAERVRELRAQGLVFGPASRPQARRGARNQVAGAVARELVERDATFADFERWDRANFPPLASDEPEALRRWWQWACKREQRAILARVNRQRGGTAS